jgi:adenylate cyclase
MSERALAFLKRYAEIWLALIVLAAAVALAKQEPTMLTSLREAVFDTYQRWQPRPYTPSPVRIVNIDDESLARIGQWPWPRTQVADLVVKLRDMGAAVIVFDILLAEPDRTSPRQVLPLWGDADPEIAALAERIADHDRVLAEAMGTTKVVTGIAFGHEASEAVLPAQKFGHAYTGLDPLPFMRVFSSAIVNRPEIDAAAAGFGAINYWGSSRVLREVPLLMRYGDKFYPALCGSGRVHVPSRVHRGERHYASDRPGWH